MSQAPGMLQLRSNLWGSTLYDSPPIPDRQAFPPKTTVSEAHLRPSVQQSEAKKQIMGNSSRTILLDKTHLHGSLIWVPALAFRTVGAPWKGVGPALPSRHGQVMGQ